jgi:hypothetical protein
VKAWRFYGGHYIYTVPSGMGVGRWTRESKSIDWKEGMKEILRQPSLVGDESIHSSYIFLGFTTGHVSM